MVWVSKSLHIRSSLRSRIRQEVPALFCRLHPVRLHREPEVDHTPASVVLLTIARLSSARSDRCSCQLEREPSPPWMLQRVLVTRRQNSRGIHRGLCSFGVESRNIVRLAGRGCKDVRRVDMGRETEGFTYGTLPRACEGSRGGPAWLS